MVIWLEIGTWIISKNGTKKGEQEVYMGLFGFVALVCILVYFCCCSVGCLCQGLQGARGMYSQYSKLVSKW
jgi:hypothetical protein